MTENPVPGAAPENRDPAGRPADPSARPERPEGLRAGENQPQEGLANETERLGAPDGAESGPGSNDQNAPSNGPRPEYPQRAPFYGQHSGPATQQFAAVPHAPRHAGEHGQQPGYNQQPGHNQPPGHGQHGAPSVFADNRANAPKRKATFGVGTLVASILAAGLVGGGVATVGSGNLFDGGSAPAVSTGSQPGTVIVNNKDDVNVITAAATKASPSVVTIKATSGGEGGTGSGVILDEQGHILTNTHVVTLDGTVANPDIEIRTNEGRVLSAKIVGTDPLSDLAVIKVDNPSGLTPATLGDSGKLNVGDTAVAIGSPLGLNGTVTDGIVSTLNRTISVASSAAPKEGADKSQGGDQGFEFAPPGQGQGQSSAAKGSISINVIQTDAAINPGNSGGALVNSRGEIIGVNVAIASAGGGSTAAGTGNIGVGFSIPINHAKRVAQEIIDNGKASHGQLGVSVKEKTSTDSTSGFSIGADVATVEPNSAAAKAGIRVGDVVTRFNDLAISDPNQLTAAVREQPAGSSVKITIQRSGREQQLDVTLGAAAEQ
ncbi:trypsin-like peptidase domain-containing protein [Arthrobacter sp. NPDC093125]|uniref:trypsin-like peptidase domain-containing protein n=1 Tax=Arthrobacter sp. NPDC093125 TaxID=3363944 RepID=UPI003803873E